MRLFKKPKVFLRITGVSVEEFEKIVKMAEPIWKEKVEQIKVVSGRPYGILSGPQLLSLPVVGEE